MTHRSPARYLAPLALLGVVVALFLVVDGSGGDTEEAVAPSTTTERTSQDAADKEQREKKQREERRERRKRETYTVQPGDTPSGIAEETGVSLEKLEELNPDLDPQSLNVGDEIRIR